MQVINLIRLISNLVADDDGATSHRPRIIKIAIDRYINDRDGSGNGQVHDFLERFQIQTSDLDCSHQPILGRLRIERCIDSKWGIERLPSDGGDQLTNGEMTRVHIELVDRQKRRKREPSEAESVRLYG